MMQVKDNFSQNYKNEEMGCPQQEGLSRKPSGVWKNESKCNQQIKGAIILGLVLKEVEKQN